MRQSYATDRGDTHPKKIPGAVVEPLWAPPRWRAGSAACQSRDPNTPLSADEAAALLRDVRAGRTGVSDLTPADRVFLHQWLGE